MVKTTIILDDDLYRRLIEECIRRYGSTRKLSKLINEKLRKLEEIEKERMIIRTKVGEKARVRLGMILKPEEIERLIDEGWVDIIKWTT
jgi:CHASE3 domain sensor protein